MSNTQSSESPAQSQNDFFVVIVSEFEAPQLLHFLSVEDAANAVKAFKREHKRFYMYVFEGRMWRTTTGPNNYLISPDADERVALFDSQDEAINDSGFIS
jgi:hypothetical protein